MPPNWVLLAVPLALLVIAYLIYSGIRNHQEQTYLRSIYDGDRTQQWKTDRWNAKRNQKLTAFSGRHFY